MLFQIGSLAGPLLSGYLTVRFGYSIMNDVMGKYAILLVFFLRDPQTRKEIKSLLEISSFYEFHLLPYRCLICWTKKVNFHEHPLASLGVLISGISSGQTMCLN